MFQKVPQCIYSDTYSFDTKGMARPWVVRNGEYYFRHCKKFKSYKNIYDDCSKCVFFQQRDIIAFKELSLF